MLAGDQVSVEIAGGDIIINAPISGDVFAAGSVDFKKSEGPQRLQQLMNALSLGFGAIVYAIRKNWQSITTHRA
ncbi:MAG: hypothetical protein ACXQS5_00750 [Candidatus Methanospirareceae archaeon]